MVNPFKSLVFISTILVLFSFLVQSANAQVYVQLELFNDPVARKYAIGDQVTYRMNYQEKGWNKGVIEEILIDANALVLSNDIISLKDVSHFMVYRQSVNIFAYLVQGFGLGWLINGAIASLIDKDIKILNVLAISGSSMAGGWIFRKLFYRVPIPLNEKNRLRIVDTRFSIGNN